MKQFRVIHYHVQIEAVADDGENLTPLDVPPVVIPAAKWDEFVAQLPDQLALLTEQINAGPPTP